MTAPKHSNWSTRYWVCKQCHRFKAVMFQKHPSKNFDVSPRDICCSTNHEDITEISYVAVNGKWEWDQEHL